MGKRSSATTIAMAVIMALTRINADTSLANKRRKKKSKPTPNPVEVDMLRGHGGAVKSVAHPSGNTFFSSAVNNPRNLGMQLAARFRIW